MAHVAAFIGHDESVGVVEVNDARLETLFLAVPISWSGTLQQYVGRLHRLHDSKREVIVYDYVDAAEPVLSKMYSKRVRGYEAVGYVIRAPL